MFHCHIYKGSANFEETRCKMVQKSSPTSILHQMAHDANKVIRFLVGSQTCCTIMKHPFLPDIPIRMVFSPKNLNVELKLQKAKTTNQQKAKILELLYLYTTAISVHPKSLVLLMHKCYKILQQAGSGTMFPGCKQGYTVLLDMYLW